MEHCHALANHLAYDPFRRAAGRYRGRIGAIGIFISLVQRPGTQWQYVLLLHQLGTMPSDTIRNRRQLHHEPVLSAGPAASRESPKITHRNAFEFRPQADSCAVSRAPAAAKRGASVSITKYIVGNRNRVISVATRRPPATTVARLR